MWVEGGVRCEFRDPLGTRKQSHSSLSSGIQKSNREVWGNLLFGELLDPVAVAGESGIIEPEARLFGETAVG
jgi:hypothetical protein